VPEGARLLKKKTTQLRNFARRNNVAETRTRLSDWRVLQVHIVCTVASQASKMADDGRDGTDGGQDGADGGCVRLPEPAMVRGRKIVPSEVRDTFSTDALHTCACVCVVIMDDAHATLFQMLRLPCTGPTTIRHRVEHCVEHAARQFEVVGVDLRDARGEQVQSNEFMEFNVNPGFFTAYVTVTCLVEASQ
jgi:hypothetical protein